MKSPFLTMVQEHMYLRRYAKRTIESYLRWIAAFIRFNAMRHLSVMGNTEVELFLSHLANQQNVAQGTQSQALNALSYLYKEILSTPLSLNLNFNKSQRARKLPVVLTKDEVATLFRMCNTRHYLSCALLYGSGLRLMEAMRLRVQDIDFDYHCIRIWDGKGGKNRVVTLAKELVPLLLTQIQQVRSHLQLDLQNPLFDGVWLPYRLRDKYQGQNKTLNWQYLFPSSKLSLDPETKHLRRHHIDEKQVQRAVKKAAQLAGIAKQVTPHAKYNLVNCYLLLSIESMCNMNNVTNLYF